MTEASIPIYGTFRSRVVGGALVEDISIIGGYRPVETIEDRDAISQTTRKAGMAVRVNSSGIIYVLGETLANDDWIELDIHTSLFINVSDSNLPLNTISLIDNSANISFINKIAAYVVQSGDNGSLVKIFGNVLPLNLPANITFGDKIYIDSAGMLYNNIDAAGTFKHIGNIVWNKNGNLMLDLYQTQINYNFV